MINETVSVSEILGNTAEHYGLDRTGIEPARKGKKQPEPQNTGIGVPGAAEPQENDSSAENPQFRDKLGRIVEIRPYRVLGETRYGPRRLNNGDWVHVPTGGNCPAQPSRDKAVELLIQHAAFMGWERAEVPDA